LIPPGLALRPALVVHALYGLLPGPAVTPKGPAAPAQGTAGEQGWGGEGAKAPACAGVSCIYVHMEVYTSHAIFLPRT